MINELLFLFQSILVAGCALAVRRLGAHALVSYVAVLAVLANLLCLKTITLFGMTASSADVFAIGSYLAFALLQRDKHPLSYKNVTVVIFLMLLFFTVITRLNLMFIPAAGDLFAGHCAALFNPMPRLMGASLLAYAISLLTTGYLLDLVRRYFPTWRPALVTLGVLFCTQLLDTALFSFTGLYGLVPNLGSIIAMSFGVKVIGVGVMTALTAWYK